MIETYRLKIIESKKGIRIIIPSKKRWYALIPLTIFVFGFYTLIIDFAFHINEFGDNSVIIAVIGNAIIGLFFLYYVLWGFFGKEIIQVSNKTFYLERSLFGKGQKKLLNIKNIKNLKYDSSTSFNPLLNHYYFDLFKSGPISFEYGLKTLTFGKGLKVSELENVFDKLNEQIKK